MIVLFTWLRTPAMSLLLTHREAQVPDLTRAVVRCRLGRHEDDVARRSKVRVAGFAGHHEVLDGNLSDGEAGVSAVVWVHDPAPGFRGLDVRAGDRELRRRRG